MLRDVGRLFRPSVIAEFRARGWWSGLTLWDLFSQARERYPDALAFSDRSRRLTFEEAALAVERVAGLAESRGIGPRSVVAVQADGGAGFALLHHALALIGATTLPLSRTLRAEDIRALLARADADVIIAPSLPYQGRSGSGYDFASAAVDLSADVPSVREVWTYGEIAGPAGTTALEPYLTGKEGGEARPSVRCLPTDDFLMLPTAGTLGIPKLVLRTHEAWISMAEARAHAFASLGVGTGDRLVCLPTVAQGVGYITGVVLPLVLPGLGVHYAEGAEPEETLSVLDEATILVGVPPQLTALMDSRHWDTVQTGALRLTLSGGAALGEAVRRRWEAEAGSPLLVAYGASDVDLVSSTTTGDTPEKRFTTVGRPLPHRDVLILARDGTPLMPGEVGEVAVSGPGQISNVYDDPQAAEAIGNGAMRLGDLGSFDDEGYLRLQGRTKDIVVRGGQNVSAAEVEGLLERHASVRTAVVVPAPHPTLGETVCAFVIPEPAAEPPSRDGLVRFLTELGIARFKIPDDVYLVERFELTPAGKIDKQLLARTVARAGEQQKAPPS